jgi:hypothetical protein
MKRPWSDLHYSPGICQGSLNGIIKTLKIAVPIRYLNPGPPQIRNRSAAPLYRDCHSGLSPEMLILSYDVQYAIFR